MPDTSLSPPKVVDSIATPANQKIISAIESIAQVILGKPEQIRLAVTCLLAQGHLLIEDQPGVGKTTLAHTIAQVMGLAFQRIQFTSDLLPADILGVSIFDREHSTFSFHAGPIFSNFILADEINRATPKTQSALLEAMEEHQVSIDGDTHILEKPFFVIATQNPSHQIGTYALPESQLDRFLMRIQLGIPDKTAERELLTGTDRRSLIEKLQPALNPKTLLELQAHAERMHVSDPVLDYIQNILALSRQSATFEYGLSPRAGLALLNAAKAFAFIDGEEYVLPEHVKQVLPAVINHRLGFLSDYGDNTQDAAAYIIENLDIP